MDTIKQWIQKNKIVTAIIIFAIIEVLIHFFFSKTLLGFFTRRYNTNWLKGLIIFISGFLCLSWGARLLPKKPNLVSFLWNELVALTREIGKQRKSLLLALGLSLFFFGFYLSLGWASTSLYGKQFTFFFADAYKWVDLNWSKYHKGSHPLMLMFVEVFGFIRAFSHWIPPLKLAVVLNSFFGAFSLFLASLFFWNYTQKYVQTILLTVVLGLTTSHLLFSVFLESYGLSAASIIANYALLIICLNQRKPYWIAWIIVGVFSFGVTITNFAQTIICFGVLLFFVKKDNRWVTIAEYIGTVIFLAFVLSVVQNKLYGGETFYAPSASGREMVWIRTTFFSEPLLIIPEIIKHFFLVNFVSASPFPEQVLPGQKIIFSFFDRPLQYSFWGWIGTLVWLFILILGFYRNLVSPIQKPSEEQTFLSVAVFLSLLLNMVFYSIFNTEEMFIYTCHFTFLVWVLATPRSLLNTRYFSIAIILLIVFMGINNLSVLRQIFSI